MNRNGRALFHPFSENGIPTEKQEATPPRVFPTPQWIEPRGNGFPLPPIVGIVTGDGTDPAAIGEVEKTLRSAGVREVRRFRPEEKPNTPVTIWIGGPGENEASEDALASLRAEGTRGLPPEGYVLATGHSENGHRKIVLAGVDGTGTYYAAKTFRQLIQDREGRPWVPEVVIRDYPVVPIRGVIEGFYGKPWSVDDRLRQIEFYADYKMNTYVYAPKNDPYHRSQWRTSYPPEKLQELKRVIDAARSHHIEFIFTISPGLDVCYSSDEDFQALVAKMQVMYDLGVRSFGILLDDITQEFHCAQDRERFGSSPDAVAQAHAYLLNRFREEFMAQHEDTRRLIMVPTEYYQPESSPYRETLAELLHPDILVYWTGIGITPARITEEDADRISEIFKHPLLIWDNYPVNDYAPHRLFLGPLRGRSPNLTEHEVVGLTANPMEQAEASKIALFTVADYTWNPRAYNPAVSWEYSLKVFGGSRFSALRTFAENTLSSPLNPEESPVLARLIQAFWRAYETGEAEEEARALLSEFQKLQQVPSALQGIENGKFLEEVRPWLDKTEHIGKTGAAAVQMLMAQAHGNPEQARQYRALLDNLLQNDTTEVVIPETRRATKRLDGVNRTRGWGELILYTPEFGAQTGTNEWGYEVTVVGGQIVKAGGNNSPIPPDGYVLSHHTNPEGNWLKENSIVGARVSIENSVVTITIEKGTYRVPNDKVMALGVIDPFLAGAVAANDLWSRTAAGPFTTMKTWQGYVLENMVDGNPETFYWTSHPPRPGDFVEVDLGQTRRVKAIRLLMGSAHSPNDYIHHGNLEVSTDGIVWQVVGQYHDQPEIDVTFAEGLDARFIRIKATATQEYWVQIREFSVIAE